MRRLITFGCAEETLLGALDEAEGATGLLIVSGGNESRAGAHRGMASLAAALATRGIPVFRYDRRGVGDSSGFNAGYEDGRDDLAAAVVAFRANAPRVARLVGFGNCDGATTLASFGRGAGVDAIILANPWVVDVADDLPPSAAIRARYAAKVRDPREWLRFMRGGVSIHRLIRGLRRISWTKAKNGDLADRTMRAIEQWADDLTVVLAKDDAAAVAYVDAARRSGICPRTITIDTASHSFARPRHADALEIVIVDALKLYSAAS